MDTLFTTPPPECYELQLLKVEQVASILAITSRNVYYLIERGDLPAVVIGGSKRVKYADLVQFVQAHLKGKESK